MVTAEIAFATLAAAVVLVVLAGVLQVLVLQLRLGNVAAETARQAARGDEVAVARVADSAPQGTRISIDERRDEVHVVVEYRHDTPVGEVPLHASAWVVVE